MMHIAYLRENYDIGPMPDELPVRVCVHICDREPVSGLAGHSVEGEAYLSTQEVRRYGVFE